MDKAALSKIKEILSMEIGGKISQKSLSILLKQWSVMLGAGVNIQRALEVSKQQAANQQIRKLVEDLYRQVTQGIPFSEALEKQNFDSVQMLASMVRAGEMSGTLDQVFTQMSDYYLNRYETRRKVKGSLIYPMLLMLVSLVVVGFILTYVMPTFLVLFEGNEGQLPASTRLLIEASIFLNQYGLVLLLTIACILVGMGLAYRKRPDFRRMVDRFLLRLPLLKQYIIYNCIGRTGLILSILSSSGVPVNEALEIVELGIQNVELKGKYQVLIRDLETGSTLHQAFTKSGSFPEMFLSMLLVGEEMGELEEVMKRSSEYYEDELKYTITSMTTLMEPVLIVIMAIVVGFIVLSIALPMFDLITYTGI